MAYIDYEYYSETFGGALVPKDEFNALSRAASDVIDALISRPFDDPSADFVLRAAAYQTEMLYLHGSEDAEAGITIALGGFNEKIGDYSIGNNRLNTGASRIKSVGGIPVSAVTVSLLRKNGYMSRLARFFF